MVDCARDLRRVPAAQRPLMVHPMRCSTPDTCTILKLHCADQLLTSYRLTLHGADQPAYVSCSCCLNAVQINLRGVALGIKHAARAMKACWLMPASLPCLPLLPPPPPALPRLCLPVPLPLPLPPPPWLHPCYARVGAGNQPITVLVK